MFVRKIILVMFIMLVSVTQAQTPTQRYITADGALNFSYSSEWVLQDSGDGVIFIASDADLLGSMDDIPVNSVGMVIAYSNGSFGKMYFEGYGIDDDSLSLEQKAHILFQEVNYGDAVDVQVQAYGGQVFYWGVVFDESRLYLTEIPSAGMVMIGIGEQLEDKMPIDAFLNSFAQSSGNDTPETVVSSGFSLPEISFHQAQFSDCSQVIFVSEQAYPTQEVTLDQFPVHLLTEQEGGGAYFVLPDGQMIDGLLTNYGTTGITTLAVPLVDSNPYVDVETVLHIVDAEGQAICEPQPFTILGLPEATGAYAETVALVGQRLELERQNLGLSREELRPDGKSELSAQGLALALAYYSYDDPDNPNSLVRMADRTAPIVQDDSYDQRLVDGLIAVSSLNDVLQQEIIVLQRDLSPVVRTNLVLSKLLFATSPTLRVNIDDFSTLVHYMQHQQNFQKTPLVGTASSSIYNDVALANSIAGVVTGPVGVAVGAVMYTAKTLNDALVYTLPAKITSFDMDYSGDITKEDDDQVYTYSNLRVTAESLGWKLQYVIIDGVLTVGGVARTVTSGTDVYIKRSLQGQLYAPTSTSQRMSDYLIKRSDQLDAVQTGAEVMSNVTSRFNDGEIVEGILTVGPYKWEDVPIRPDEISSPTIVTAPHVVTPAIRITDSTKGEYRARNVGFAYMRFEASIGTIALVLVKPISVEQIVIDWDYPSQIVLSEGDEYCFETEIRNANDVRGRFTAEGYALYDYVDGDSYCFKAPDRVSDQWTEPFDCSGEPQLMAQIYTVTYESLADRGARDRSWNPSWEPRQEYMVIRVEPKPENHPNAAPPANPNCETFSGNWEFTLISEQSYICTGHEPESMTTRVNLASANGGANLRSADYIVATSHLVETMVLAWDDDKYAFVGAGEMVDPEDGQHFRVEWELYLSGTSEATILATGSSMTIYGSLPTDTQDRFPLCERIGFFFVYEGVYIGD